MRDRLTVGVLIPFLGGFYFASLLEGARRAARERSARIVAFQTTGLDLFWAAEETTRPLGWNRIDAWLGMTDLAGSAHYDRVAAARKPLVTVSCQVPGYDTCAVLPDNQGGARLAVAHLVAHGHRKIAFAGSTRQTDVRERYEGYKEGLRAAGIDPDPALFFEANSARELDGREVGRRLLSADLPCTAVIAGTDLNAVGIAHEVQWAGRRIPGDLAVVGFDDVEPAQYAATPIATLRLPYEAVGYRAAELLLRRVIDGETLPATVRLPVTFVGRASCGCSAFGELWHAEHDETSRERFERRLRELLGGIDPQGPPAPAPGDAAATLASHVGALVHGDPGLDGAALRAACCALLADKPDAERVERLLSAVEEAAWDRLATASPALGASARGALRELRFELLRVWRSTEQMRLGYDNASLDANRRIQLALVSSTGRDPSDLGWMSWSRTRCAVFGQWRPATGDGRRRFVEQSVYHRTGPSQARPAEEHPPEEIPTAELCALADEAADDIVSVVPIQGAGANRGLLIVVGPIHHSIVDLTGNLAQWSVLLGAALDREELAASLKDSALHDALTGLPNRAQLIEKLDQALVASRAGDGRCAVLLLDLDGFKNVNDGLGHASGDQLLLKAAERLRDSVRPVDTVARIGGDEFALLLKSLEREAEASAVAERIHDALRAPFFVGGHRVFSSASVGITMSSDKYVKAEDFLRDADTAMQRAKAQGRARHQVFQAQMRRQTLDRLRLEAEIRHGLERGEFVLHYQPIVALGGGAVVEVEALIRWKHPEKGLVAPTNFLSVAEESGLIVRMSDWVIRTACEQANRWKREIGRAIRINVNLAPTQLEDPRFIELLRSNVARAGLQPATLGVELVESSLAAPGTTILDNLLALRQMGMRIAVDDFGTGYSSLGYLKRLPVHVLKIDRSFILGVPSDAHDVAICKAIVAMAQSLQLAVVAEGVETAQQAEFLRSIGCELAQGYLFAEPLPARECVLLFGDVEEAARYEPEWVDSQVAGRSTAG